MRKRLAALLALLLLVVVPLAAQDKAKPVVDKPPQAPATADPAKEKEKEDKDKPKWDVAKPPYAYDVSVPLDLTEGTWLSLDVSPDGKEIVFDLLGDLYTLPIGGGEARSLTSGIPWDMQPRYSPDGKWIAFTSDRSGGDNIWIIGRDGKNPQQVTKESFRLPNSPAWTPDSQYIAARKHYTGTRSLGAGEIWLYHRSGGEGLQMTKRATEQKDDGEPAFSPDSAGRYLYWSADTTPGKIYDYNKDVNGQIYVIKRLDRETGKIIDFVTGPGGSVRPTPSPDGKSLAFVRRVRYKSTLFVKDLESGIERPIWDGLERDMQETWAVQGVYPGIAWTPDSRSVVLWAGGKFHRVDVANRKTADIPFHVKDSRQAAHAVRFGVDVLTGVMQASASPQIVGTPTAPTFPVRMLRWVTVSPDGKRVAYQALGYIYVKDLPGGAPHRLTKQTDHYEYFPSWSRDSKSIVYSTWNDETYGSVRVAPSVAGKAGAERVVTDKPGHYLDPVFSPDGTKIVYRKDSGGYLRSTAWSSEPGLYWVSAGGGGKPALITEDGATPRFGKSNERVFFVKNEGGGDQAAPAKRILVSIRLDGSDPHEMYLSELATEFEISPNGQWLAFREGFNAYITPFVETGRRVDIGPKSKAVPVTRVSRDAGEFLHFSGDSSRLYWAYGPQLYQRDLKEAFAFLPGAPEKLPEPGSARGLDIGFVAPVDVPPSTSTIAFTGGRVVTMNGNGSAQSEVLEDGVVLIEGNRIKAVGRKGDVAIPRGAKTFDVSGKTILPGFVDAHYHGQFGSDEILPQQNWHSDASLALGVTTVHDPSNDTGEVFSAAELARAGMLRAPRIFSTGTILYGAAGDFKADIDSLDDALAHLRRMKAAGAISVKSYNQPRREQRQQILAAAREVGIMVVPEGGSLFEMNMTMVVDGHTTVEHTIPVPNAYADVTALWPPGQVAYTPTLLVAYGGLFGENYWYQKTNVWEHPILSKFVPPFVLDPRSRRRIMAPEDEFNHFNEARIAATLSKDGVTVNTGAHGQREGLGLHWELWMLVQGGLSPLEALRCATLNGAKTLGMDRDIGSLQAGKLADLVVIDRNPLQDIRQSDKVVWTMVNGRLYEAATLNETGSREKKRTRYWWE